MKLKYYSCMFTLIVTFALGALYPVSAQSSSPQKLRIYDRILSTKENPHYERYHVKPPDWDAFDNRTRFIYVTDFKIEDGLVVDYVEKLEKYQRDYDLGDIFQMTYPIIYAKNLADFAAEIKKRGIFLFNLYGYVPGSGPGGLWSQYKSPPEAMEILESTLGEQWLGMNNGEQDGRYVGGFAHQMYPSSANRLEQYLNFQRHFEKHGDDVGNKMSIMVSLNFGHYYVKEGVYTINGAETGQALPNSQVYYSFIRGAGKQYGMHWYCMASVFNRWGYKSYSIVDTTGRNNIGPTKGTSLNLFKRLLYSHILYNSAAVSLDLFHLVGDELSPIGRMQKSAKEWVAENGQPGTMLTPVAIMLDFFSGWSFPRHLYSRNVYRVWGNLPYEPGDYLSDGVIDMLYPGYQNSSYYHDESGFNSSTPYGDAADCILSDAPGWLLERYPALVIGGELSGGLEIRDKLQKYIEGGGRLFITAGSLAKLPGGLAGIQVSGPAVRFKPSKDVNFGLEKLNENVHFELCPLNLPDNAKIRAVCGDMPAVVEAPCGKGIITVFANPFGVGTESAVKGPITIEIDKPLLKPYPLLKHVHSVLDEVFRSQMLFEVDDELSLIACRKEPGLYTLGICNNSLQEKPLQIVSHCGPIEQIRELETDQSAKQDIGYMPEGFENVDVGTSGDWSIAGGDVLIFEVRVREGNVENIPHVTPPPRPRGFAFPLRRTKSIKEEILARPTFFDHFDRVVVDWKYLRQREKDILEHEAGWIGRQKLGIVVDLTSGLNLYPDLRLVNNLEEDYLASMAAIEDVMEKMEILGSSDLLLTLHRGIENNFTREQTRASFDSTLRELCKKAERRKITVHLRTCFGKPPRNLKEALEFIGSIGAPNLRLAPSTALLLTGDMDIKETAELLKDKVGMWIVSLPEYDIAGKLWNTNVPIAGYDREQEDILAQILAINPDAVFMLDGIYKNHDEEYLDTRALHRLAAKVRH